MKVELVAYTCIDEEWMMEKSPKEWAWPVNANGAEILIEFAGRNCYQSWTNPGKKTNAEYIQNIIKQGHGSVLEHASVTFYITDVSRSLTHELIRHRHFSFSELSQRYVDVGNAEFIVPPALENTMEPDQWLSYLKGVRGNYYSLCGQLEVNGMPRKEVRQAARSVMPNCTETKIVVTGNLRAWRGFIDQRATEHADAEMCRLATEVCRQLKEKFPAVFKDYEIVNGYCWTHNRKV